VKLLPDTQLILWAFDNPGMLSRAAVALFKDDRNEFLFSAVSVWETAIKSALNKRDFQVDARELRSSLLKNGYEELPITSQHAVASSVLPAIHKDPFDRLLIAQATVEDILLLTADRQIAKYPGPIRKV
jgi:PIN domain nuclease of toxin-antitoxin system